ncbi:hypothetical protein LOTGIDRAFT_238248 [Lottia gigantea]|uniref:RNA-binding protein 48 n=1 Tax=Lottia gigantea TaxID=225164 RepID=V4B216_LOTGI|nr:hypothetical protein LOTGIDRAFT_238248 [Lottia gigantea]ESP01556.1 hypothetical protein LOTGIDRAFT_238248 [Lottia gigantea]
MSAPSSHHIRQNVCANRPAYRDGRQPKAVKVYTVAQESCYLLIQGVQAVGAHTDLNTLCSGFGVLKSFQALDDYPSEQFTEVYLVQYERIQSARYAKRKMDDMSFFGGVLHVCYAPEFESVQETREKLQDRRRQVAAKIRQNEKERGPSKTIVEDLQNQLEKLEQNYPNSSNNVQRSVHNHKSTLKDGQNTVLRAIATSEVSQHEQRVPPLLNYTDPHSDLSTEFHLPNFSIPPPPQYGIHPHYAPRHHQGYGFANVPSAHATLPMYFDERLCDNHSRDSELKQKISKDDLQEKTKSVSESHKIVKGLVVKDYKSNHPVPKFVPRQATKNINKPDTTSKVKDTDKFNKEIRKNAFTLGEPQGPEKPVDLKSQSLDITREAVVSVNSSVKEIRKQVAKFSSDPPLKKKKKIQ